MCAVVDESALRLSAVRAILSAMRALRIVASDERRSGGEEAAARLAGLCRRRSPQIVESDDVFDKGRR